MCFGGGGTTQATQTVAGHTFTPTVVSPSLYSSGIPASTNYANYAAPANYYQSPAATGGAYSILGASNPAYQAPANYFRTASTGLPTVGQSTTPSLLSRIGKEVGNIGKSAAGGLDVNALLKMGAGFSIPNPKMEGALPTSEDLLAKYKGMEISPEGTASKAKMLEYINNPSAIGGTATTDYVKALNAQFDATDAKELANFDAAWQAQGYSTTGSDYFKARSDLQNQQGIRRNTATSAAQVNLLQSQIQAQLTMIASAYGIDQQMLTELMNLDLTEAAMKYGISVEKVTQFRKAVYDLALADAYNKQGNTTASAVQNLIGGQNA